MAPGLEEALGAGTLARLEDSADLVAALQALLEPGGHFVFVIDAHCDFRALASFFTQTLPKLEHSSSDWSAALLFTSPYTDTPTPPLDATVGFGEIEGEEERKRQINLLRQNQFFIRMVMSYEWGTFCRADRLPAFIERVQGREDVYLRLNAGEIKTWDDDVERLWAVVAKKLRLGPWIGSVADPDKVKLRNDHYASQLFPGIERQTLLTCLAIVHQFGRLDQAESEAAMKRSGIAWFSKCNYFHWFPKSAGRGETSASLPPSPPRCRELLNLETQNTMRIWEEGLGEGSKEEHSRWLRRLASQAGRRNVARAAQFLFEMLNDMSQYLSKGCAHWAVSSMAEVDNEKRPLRVLAIKDYVRDPLERERLTFYFQESFRSAFRPGTVELHCIEYDRGVNQERLNQKWDTHDWWLKHLSAGERVHARDYSSSPPAEVEHALLDYDILLIEADFETRFVGPSIIQWLDNAFDEFCAGKRRPQIFVLSRNESAGHSFMCLRLGAQAFASKSRIFGIPSLLTMANVGRWTTAFDTKKLRPNFFAIEGLLPHHRNRLQSTRPHDLIVGDRWDSRWIECLPKADLHYHIGTSITLDSIKAMAANTAGYTLDPSSRARANSGDDPIGELIRNACKIVLLTSLVLEHNKNTKQAEKFEVLWAVARYLLLPIDEETNKLVHNQPPEFGAIEKIVAWLVRKDRPVREFEACAVLVTTLHLFESYTESLRAGENPNGFDSECVNRRFSLPVETSWLGLMLLQGLISGTGKGDSLAQELSTWLDYLMKRIDMNWKDAFTDLGSLSSADHLECLARSAVERCQNAFEMIAGVFGQLISDEGKGWIAEAEKAFRAKRGKDVFGPDQDLINIFAHDPSNTVRKLGNEDSTISLREIVVLPDSEPSSGAVSRRSTKRTLQRYLIGSGLLGAEHLQFPENIILAGLDIARQNVQDNVVYSEVRCATTGYCQGGMNVYDATDLLCLSFDLGSLLFGGWQPRERAAATETILSERNAGDLKGLEAPNGPEEMKAWWSAPPQRWVRMNVLLGAKRHKPSEILRVVNLVTQYLERGPERSDIRQSPSKNGKLPNNDVPGLWWRRCSVVGFDLSGNERFKISDLRTRVDPLFKACAPITIHAGEAMTADSIWEAVYHLNAQRIGHGLRLRDNKALLEHCVRRGICMELCPISNSFTNVFHAAPVEFEPNGKLVRRDQYPIKDFLTAGLDICLGTDNRSLHQCGRLSDEYLRAAKLSEGLSRWEVLRICKAAFKNAFLPKEQIAALLRHVEYEIYKLASEHSGENEFPSVEHVRRLLGDEAKEYAI